MKCIICGRIHKLKPETRGKIKQMAKESKMFLVVKEKHLSTPTSNHFWICVEHLGQEG